MSLFRKLLGKILGRKAEKKVDDLVRRQTPEVAQPGAIDPDRPWKTLGRRQPRIVRLWDRSMFKSKPSKRYAVGAMRRGEEPVEYSGKERFRTSDGHTFAVHMSGAFVRTDKERRPVKERKAAARAAREVVAAS